MQLSKPIAAKGFVMISAEIVPPDEPYNVAEVGVVLRKSGRQVLRYLESGALRGSRASGNWTVTALQIWQYQGIADDMMSNWREYCRSVSVHEENVQNQIGDSPGE